MKVKAIKKDGGLFIPDIENQLPESEIIYLEIEIDKKENIIEKTAGILKGKIGDGIAYQQKIRNEWDNR